MNRPISFIVIGVIILAALGFGVRLFEDPMSVLTTILILVVVAGVAIFVFNKFSSTSHSNQKAYKRAVKQSKKKHQQKGLKKDKASVVNYSSAQKNKHRIRSRKKSTAQLTVIEGKKGKKKNRA